MRLIHPFGSLLFITSLVSYTAFVVHPSGQTLSSTSLTIRANLANKNLHPDKDIYRPSKVESGEYDAIVIGSGVGGLTTASLMAQAGKKVLVLEQHYVAGGACHTFKSKGYEFATGIHYVGELGETVGKGVLDLSLKHLVDSVTPVDDPLVFDRMNGMLTMSVLLTMLAFDNAHYYE
jgi:hypothetical protein